MTIGLVGTPLSATRRRALVTAGSAWTLSIPALLVLFKFGSAADVKSRLRSSAASIVSPS